MTKIAVSTKKNVAYSDFQKIYTLLACSQWEKDIISL